MCGKTYKKIGDKDDWGFKNCYTRKSTRNNKKMILLKLISKYDLSSS